MSSGARLNVHNPYDGSVVGSVPDADAADVPILLEQLHRGKRGYDPQLTRQALSSLAAELPQQARALASQISLESGLCLNDSLYELERVTRCVAAVLQLLERPDPQRRRSFPGGELEIIKEPADLVYAITPFNHPLLQVCHKILPAIAVGAPVLLKPCEKAPLSAKWLVEFLWRAGIPKNLLQLVITSLPADVTKRVLADDALDVLTFTGSHATWTAISEAVLRAGRVTLRQICELGGSSPLVVCADADLDLASAAIISGFRNSGQRCTAPRKLFLHRAIADQLLQRLVPAVQSLKVGAPLSPETEVGTLIDEAAALLVERRIDEAREGGAQILCGGRRVGAQVWPTLLLSPHAGSALLREETFGPVLPVLPFQDLSEVVDVVTASNRYRLAGALFSQSSRTARGFAEAIKVGQFNWNALPGFRLEDAPFGGFGWSGNGAKEGVDYTAKGYQKQRTFYDHQARIS